MHFVVFAKICNCFNKGSTRSSLVLDLSCVLFDKTSCYFDDLVLVEKIHQVNKPLVEHFFDSGAIGNNSVFLFVCEAFLGRL